MSSLLTGYRLNTFVLCKAKGFYQENMIIRMGCHYKNPVLLTAILRDEIRNPTKKSIISSCLYSLNG